MKLKLSILPINCLALCLAAQAGAQAAVTMVVKTGISCNWKLDGQPMGPLTAAHPTVILVMPGEHFLEAAPTDGTATITTRVEIDEADKAEKTINIGLKTQTDQQAKPRPKKLSAVDAAKNPTWTGPTTGLMWTSNENGSDVDQPQAVAYCTKSQYAGYDDWRLPTPEELQELYDSKNSVERVIAGVTYQVHLRGELNLSTGWVWSARQGDHPGRPYQSAWFFQFLDAGPHFEDGKPRQNFLHFDFNMRAVCVRRP